MRLAVFASGNGSNFQSIVDASARGTLAADVVLCVASRSGAGVLEKAQKAGIPSLVLDGPIEDSLDALVKALNRHQVDFIALAGFMKKVPAGLIRLFPNRIVNIHPALLPDFGGQGMYGMHVHRAVLASGTSVSGATVHLVDDDYDTGPIVLQSSIPVLETDTPESLAERVLKTEHVLYPKALQLFAEGKISIKDGAIRITS